MLDALIPAAEGLRLAAEAGDSVEAGLMRSAALARAGAEATRGMRARAGRARAFAESSIGHPDAGATSSAILLSALADRARALAEARGVLEA
jgi:dihydroxyacetone kinase-like protein